MDLYPSDDPIFLRVAKKLSEMTGVPVEQIRPSDRLFDYAEDSLDVVELVMFMEDEFKKNIADDDLGKLETVSDLVEHLRKLID